jgi:hypothetical protein
MVKLLASTLEIHPVAQRGVLPSRIKEMEKCLDLDALGVFHAVEYERAGKRGIWVIDGQHRLLAMKERDVLEFPVDVMIHLDVKDDARACALFLKLNKRASVNPYDMFTNELAAKFPPAVGIAEICKESGLPIVRGGSQDGRIVCVCSLKKVWAYDAGITLKRTLEVSINAWGANAHAVEGKLIEGLAAVIFRYDGKLDLSALTTKLAKHPGGASGLIGHARTFSEMRKKPVSRALSQLVIDIYNSGKRVTALDPL